MNVLPPANQPNEPGDQHNDQEIRANGSAYYFFSANYEEHNVYISEDSPETRWDDIVESLNNLFRHVGTDLLAYVEGTSIESAYAFLVFNRLVSESEVRTLLALPYGTLERRNE